MAFLELGKLKTKRSSALVLTTFLFVFAYITQAQPGSKEYQMKAVFLFNFTQFIEWPENSLPEESTPFVIGILGEDPFGSHLQDAIKNEKVQSHPLVIKHVKDVNEAGDCQILFINISNQSTLKNILTSLKGKSILTVGDANNFSKHGGVVRFYSEENKIRIRINLEASRENGLTISSKLLRLADIVETQRN
jgi:hypothetical protein